MSFTELSNEQARQSIDAAQAYRVWREAAVRTWNAHSGDLVAPMSWRTQGGRDYLVSRMRGYRRHHGPRSAETEQMFASYSAERERVIARMKGTYARLAQMAPVNRAMGLGRIPTLTASILRELDEHGFLGGKVTVVGTNAIYAYEAKAGVHVASPLMETTDADLLWDARQKLTLAIDKLPPPAVLALLRGVDASFDAGRQYGFSAQNADGFIVELLAVDTGSVESTGMPGDMAVNPMIGMDALLLLPRFEAVAIDRRGMPLRIVTPEIRMFTLLKEWVARQTSRPPEKRRRDREQARVLRELATVQFGLSFDAADLRQVPEYLTTP